jgi:competence protein ComEC
VVHVGERAARIGSWARVRAGDRIALGAAARGTVVHVDPDARDLNDASLVLRLDLGRASALFTGDATGGKRAAPSAPPAAGSAEHAMIAASRRLLDVDVLQVGHHGSRTSSRARFLDAVTPAWALVSSGPMEYGPVVLPDPDVVAELARRGARVLRTDANDAGCGARADKTGRAGDGKPGGCDGFRLRISPSGRIAAEPW